ncbi:MAG: HAMP domain-containing histidine kinase [Deltaproteobacteria bacterium]|nr:HAMP domain-containing histidine kinase [Deltaproteobacteria bacterium]
MAAAGVEAPAPFDPLAVVRQVAEAARDTASGKGLRFDVEAPEVLPRALGDETGFRRALGHVVENALKFTEAGGVRLEACAVGDRVRFTVSDTGPGIPREHAERIFEPFHQVEFGDTRTASGLGIGLSLARDALDRMGGALRLAYSGPGGSAFELELPVEPRPPRKTSTSPEAE